MKESCGFWHSLENYTWKIIKRLSPAIPLLGVGIVALIITTSAYDTKTSLASSSGLVEAALRAAYVGDYELAQDLWERQAIKGEAYVLGVESEHEDKIYPERVVEREIEKYEELLAKYPGHRDIYLMLAGLYGQIDKIEQSEQYLELARELDPNNATLKSQITNSQNYK